RLASPLDDRRRGRVAGIAQQGHPPRAAPVEMREVADLEVDRLPALEASEHGRDLRGPAREQPLEKPGPAPRGAGLPPVPRGREIEVDAVVRQREEAATLPLLARVFSGPVGGRLVI